MKDSKHPKNLKKERKKEKTKEEKTKKINKCLNEQKKIKYDPAILNN